MEPEIQKFVTSIGATEPDPSSDIYKTFRQLFKRHNYFILTGNFLIIKISRSKKPFWGVGKDYIEFLNMLNNYYLVLLTGANEGWVFNKSEINYFLSSKRWNLREEDNNYKINPPLPDKNSFITKTKFFQITGIEYSRLCQRKEYERP
jgi:hypothetical protein